MHSSIILILLATRIVSGMSLRSVKTAILFDIDGTLCDSSGLCFDSTNIVLTNNGFKPIALQEYKEGSKYTTPRRFAWHVCKNPDDGIGNRLGDEFDRLYVALVSPDSVPLFPGIEEMLIEMKSDDASIMFGALTNACGAYARAIHACNPVLLNNFDICYGVDDVPAAKPSGEGLSAMLKRLNIEPEKAIYIGDAPTDGQAATAAGVKSIGVTWGSYARSVMVPNFNQLVDTPLELKAAVKDMLSL